MSRVQDRRDGFVIGFRTALGDKVWKVTPAEILELAASTFPAKTITRPREVHDEATGFWYRVVDGRLQFKSQGGKSWSDADTSPTLADLFAHPTEEVEVDP